ncbi:GIY-YIG nuclease family protein [Undibacterium sp.]|uniref:GIY-YIG nuclease family protein n=1 Tax=Undibacterium sp. TaxID=1914977 RepID=UPI003750B811
MNKQILTQLNDGLMNDTFNYVVMFDNGNAKTGITKNPYTRLQNYIQESLRSGIRVTGYNITPPSSKVRALRIETILCNIFHAHKIDGLKEWFSSNDWPNNIIGGAVSEQMTCFWKSSNCVPTFYDFEESPYRNMIKHAASLGERGFKFNAQAAARAADKNVTYYKCLAIRKKKKEEFDFLLSHEFLSPAMWALKQARSMKAAEVAA